MKKKHCPRNSTSIHFDATLRMFYIFTSPALSLLLVLLSHITYLFCSDSIKKLNSAVEKQDKELTYTRSEMEDAKEKARSVQNALDSSYK